MIFEELQKLNAKRAAELAACQGETVEPGGYTHTRPDAQMAPVSPSDGQLTSEDIKMLRETVIDNFYVFCTVVLEYVFPNSWLVPHVHKPLCDALQQYETNKKLRIVFPRSWLKSTICSIYYPIWRACRNPNVRVLIVQNTVDNARKKLHSIRQQFDMNPLLQVLFPEILPGSREPWTDTHACLKRSMPLAESTFEVAGVRTGLTSRHFDVIVEDDTVAPDFDEMGEDNIIPMKDDIGHAVAFHKSMTGLLDSIQHSQTVVVGTRWFHNDLHDWISKNEPDYVTIIRAVTETNGKPDLRGEIQYPERFNDEALVQLKQRWGIYLYSCLYLNTPMSNEDMIFKLDWVKYYEVLPASVVCTTTVDPAGGRRRGRNEKIAKIATDTDYNVVLTWGKDTQTGFIYICEISRFRGNAGALINKIFEHVRRWSSVCVGIEANQYQNVLDYFTEQEMIKRNDWFRVEMIGNYMDKETRIRGLQPLYEAGLIHHKHHMKDLEHEMELFPLGKHDDILDALSMQLQIVETISFARTRNRSATERAMEELLQQDDGPLSSGGMIGADALADIDSQFSEADDPLIGEMYGMNRRSVTIDTIVVYQPLKGVTITSSDGYAEYDLNPEGLEV